MEKLTIENVASVNNEYIFLKDNTRLKTKNYTSELMEIYRQAKKQEEFYNKAYNETSELFRVEMEELRQVELPSMEEILYSSGRDIDKYLELTGKKEKYFKRLEQIEGMNEVAKHFFEASRNMEKLCVQLKRVTSLWKIKAMTKADFIALVEYASDNWKGNFSKEEKQEYTSDLYSSALSAREHGLNSEYAYNIKSTMKNLKEDASNGIEVAQEWINRLEKFINQ